MTASHRFELALRIRMARRILRDITILNRDKRCQLPRVAVRLRVWGVSLWMPL